MIRNDKKNSLSRLRIAAPGLLIAGNLLVFGLALFFSFRFMGGGLGYFLMLKEEALLAKSALFPHRTFAASLPVQPPQSQTYASDGFIIKFKSDLSVAKSKNKIVTGIAALNTLNARYGIASFKKFNGGETVPAAFDNVYLFRAKSNLNVADALESYKKNPQVAYIEPNYLFAISQGEKVEMVTNDLAQPAVLEKSEIFKEEIIDEKSVQIEGDVQPEKDPPAIFTPNDPHYAEQWALAKLDMQHAWGSTKENNPVVIASVDTGVDYMHADLRGTMWTNPREIPNNHIDDDNNGYIDDVRGWNFYAQNNDPMDDFGHGTHTAGIMAASINNGIGIAGICPTCTIMPLKFLGQNGYGSGYDAAQAIVYAVDNGAQVINNSWGGTGELTILREAFQHAYDKHVVVIAAAGNSSTNSTVYPADYPHVIKVAASEQDDQRAPWSNFGTKVDVSAPGVTIISTVPSTNCYLCDPSGYRYLSGTSMAAPHIAAIAGMLLSYDGLLTTNGVRERIRHGIDHYGTDTITPDSYVGAGRTNAFRALTQQGVTDSIASLSTPADFPVTEMNSTSTFKGTAGSEYKLAFGRNPYGTIWHTFATGPAGPENKLGALNFGDVTPGMNFIRLSVDSGSGLANEDIVNIYRNEDVEISNPQSSDINRLNDVLDIQGFVRESKATYTMDYADTQTPNSWSSQGITLLPQPPSSEAPVSLATWNTNILSPNHSYTLRLSTVRPDGIVRQQLVNSIYFDPTLRPGWPRHYEWNFVSDPNMARSAAITDTKGNFMSAIPRIGANAHMKLFMKEKNETNTFNLLNYSPINSNTSNSTVETLNQRTGGVYYWGGPMDPVAADINHDGQKEIFFEVGGSPVQVHGLNPAGDELPGWPVKIPDVGLPGGNLVAPTIVDINGDGEDEVLVVGGAGIYAFGYDGEMIHSIPLQGAGYHNSQIVARDLDHNGSIELIKVYIPWDMRPYGLRMTVMDTKGTMNSGWPQLVYDEEPFPNMFFGCGAFPANISPAVGDLDHDGVDEIVTVQMRNVFANGQDSWSGWHCDSRMYAFRKNGALLPGFPRDLSGIITASPAIGDVDKDGFNEITVGTVGAWPEQNPQYYVIKNNGSDLNGWPRSALQASSWGSPALGDIDTTTGTSTLEIAYSQIGSVYSTTPTVFNSNGTINTQAQSNVVSLKSLLIGDVNGDNFSDFFAGAWNFYSAQLQFGIYAWNHGTGALLTGFPKKTEPIPDSAPVLTDLNNDHTLELIGTSSQDARDLNNVIDTWKYRGSIYVWNLNTPDRPWMPWPMFHQGIQHTGLLEPPITVKPKSKLIPTVAQ